MQTCLTLLALTCLGLGPPGRTLTGHSLTSKTWGLPQKSREFLSKTRDNTAGIQKSPWQNLSLPKAEVAGLLQEALARAMREGDGGVSRSSKKADKHSHEHEHYSSHEHSHKEWNRHREKHRHEAVHKHLHTHDHYHDHSHHHQHAADQEHLQDHKHGHGHKHKYL